MNQSPRKLFKVTSAFGLRGDRIGYMSPSIPVYEFGRSARLKTRILIACFSLCICFGSVFAVSQTFSFQFLQKPGPYPVGLKVVDQYDRSRAYPASPKNLSKSSVGDDARPLQTLIWYPSLRSTGKPLSLIHI